MRLADQLIACFKEIPRYFRARFWRWIASVHEPWAVGPPRYTWCACCDQPWPCKPRTQADGELAALTKGVVS